MYINPKGMINMPITGRHVSSHAYRRNNMINEEIMYTCETHVNEDTSNIIKYI
jgi:hypothetical protein